ncbi:MAG: copper homeostasis protein CutC [Gemmatimonadota bacterium]|nr:copper homeostasis protein CutC [Gemmatimonadota bacterium]
MLLEACVASVESAVAAAAGGAARLELNRELERDGLTPPIRLLRDVLAASGLPVIAMIRPHDDGFRYDAGQLDDMARAADELLAAGAAGVAVGPLDAAGAIDRDALGRFIEIAGSRGVVFHRAFDRVTDRAAALEELVDAGVVRVLTSAGARTAAEGVDGLAALVRQASGRIGILPGGGVGPDNAAAIVHATGCRELHGTFRDPGRPSGGTDAGVVARVRRAAVRALSPGGPPAA